MTDPRKEALLRRKLAAGGGRTLGETPRKKARGLIGDAGAHVVAVQQRKKRAWRTASVAGTGSFYNPSNRVAKAIDDSLKPEYAPSPVRTLADMSPEEIAELERIYGVSVKR